MRYLAHFVCRGFLLQHPKLQCYAELLMELRTHIIRWLIIALPMLPEQVSIQTELKEKTYGVFQCQKGYAKGTRKSELCTSDRKIAVNGIRSPIECQIQCMNYADGGFTCSCFEFWQSSRRCALYADRINDRLEGSQCTNTSFTATTSYTVSSPMSALPTTTLPTTTLLTTTLPATTLPTTTLPATTLSTTTLPTTTLPATTLPTTTLPTTTLPTTALPTTTLPTTTLPTTTLPTTTLPTTTLPTTTLLTTTLPTTTLSTPPITITPTTTTPTTTPTTLTTTPTTPTTAANLLPAEGKRTIIS
ncbi:hypothetical protein EB796_020059 [Bugula neritina]|uniref:Apple domain-containing protein n=1 Tax=Bugula neritina TaxID=10212 RepID=A0A7J7J7T5_BUGNE|nr:hypothetical protein EB796_020059 [Bugula neritina]